jgi:hypothetical protein
MESHARTTVSTELPDGRVTRISVLVFVNAYFGFIVELDIVGFDD